MIVKNDAEKLRRCLNSAKDIADEIVIADTGSTDNAKEVASEFGCRVFDYKWNDNFSAARNFALSKAESDWILVLDSDEYITSADKNDIEKFISGRKAIGKIKRIDSFDNDGVLSDAVCYISRLFPKGVRYTGRIHEQLDSNLERKLVGIEVGHDGYLERSAEKSKRNLRILEKELKAKPNAYYYYQISKEYDYLKNYEKEYEYLKTAYKAADKNAPYYPGLVVQYMYNLLKLKKFEAGLEVIETWKDRYDDYPDFLFVCGLFYIDLVMSNPQKYISCFNLIEESFQKCLKIGENSKYEGVLGSGSFSALHNLGSFYECMGNKEKAIEYYKKASEYNYAPSIERLKILAK